MLNIALSTLETAINKYLRLDPTTIEELKSLEGKTVQITLTDWDVRFYIQPSTNGVNLLPVDDNTVVDTVIKGRLASLMSIGIHNDMSSKTLIDNQITISGDHKTGETLRGILKGIDIDWEDHLANLTNDSFAHLAANQAKNLLNFTKDTFNRLQQQFHDYLHHETQLTPSQNEVDQFFKEIRELRDATERLETKIRRLTTEDTPPC